jgi:hypothetical protein
VREEGGEAETPLSISVRLPPKTGPDRTCNPLSCHSNTRPTGPPARNLGVCGLGTETVDAQIARADDAHGVGAGLIG